MNVKFFIDRPVFSMVISITIVFAGIIGLNSLPVEQYPDIAPPTVQVTTSYPGASAETVQKSVIAPLEQAINGVENMMYMSSEASNGGAASISIYFVQGTDPDMAAVNVQNRVSKATGTLPAEVNQIGVSTNKRQSSILRAISLYSPNGTYDETFIGNYMKLNVQPDILRVQGVGDMVIWGPDYSMRIWLKPDVMAQYQLIPADVVAILAEQNIESATGSFGENADNGLQFTMRYTGRKVYSDEFGDMVIKALPTGEVLRLRDIAEIELGKDDYSFMGQTNGAPGITSLIFQVPGSNATEVNLAIDALMDEMRLRMPKDLKLITLSNTNDFLYASINEVVFSLIIAIFLVIFVVYFFLQDFRTTLIPSVAIVVSLVGTFAFLSIWGYSLNLLTLFALVLAIGTVVDDAIVVVEAVQAKFDAGYQSPYKASVDAMKGLVSPIITTTLVFMAVFVPVTFMGGTTGTFYTQFGVTMSIAVAISTLNALTLSPALCALVLKPNPLEGEKKNFASRVRMAYRVSFKHILAKYVNGVLFFIRRPILVWSVLALTTIGLVYLMRTTKTGFVPDEDTGLIFVNVTTAPGLGLKETDKVISEIELRIKDIPQIDNYARVTGYGLLSGQGATFGMFIVKLKHWDDRSEFADHIQAVIGQIYARTADVKDAQIFAISPGMIPGYGMGGGFELHVQDKQGGDLEALQAVTQQFIGALIQRPEIAMAFSSFDTRYPQYEVSIDAVKAKRAGLSPRDILGVLSGYYGGLYASNFNRFTRVYRVMVQADPKYRLDKESLSQVFVRNGTEMAPISEFVTLQRVYGPVSMTRFNMYNSIAVNGVPAPGYSSGEAIAAIKEVAATSLPRGYAIDFGGITREENETENTTVLIFAICLVFVYLILSALYESFFVPLAVLFSVPFGLTGCFLFAKFMGLENNIYLQTGLIMIIGLLAKTAILLTEYATEKRRSGMSLSQAAYMAAKERLRPILMTVLTMVFGMLPLMFATGVGANGNSSLGTGVVGGMLIGTLAMLFFVPTFFIAFQSLQEYFTPNHKKRQQDEMD